MEFDLTEGCIEDKLMLTQMNLIVDSDQQVQVAINKQMNVQSKHRSLRILKIVQIEKQHRRHRKRLLQIEKGNGNIFPKESTAHRYSSIRHLKTQVKENELKHRRKRIQLQNLHIHQQLRKVYNRSNSFSQLPSQRRYYSKSERSILKRLPTDIRKDEKQLHEENLRLHSRIVGAHSTLNRDKLFEQYSHLKLIKNRIESNSPTKKQDLKEFLRKKFHILPSVVLPNLKHHKGNTQQELGKEKSFENYSATSNS